MEKQENKPRDGDEEEEEDDEDDEEEDEEAVDDVEDASLILFALMACLVVTPSMMSWAWVSNIITSSPRTIIPPMRNKTVMAVVNVEPRLCFTIIARWNDEAMIAERDNRRREWRNRRNIL